MIPRVATPIANRRITHVLKSSRQWLLYLLMEIHTLQQLIDDLSYLIRDYPLRYFYSFNSVT